MSALGLRSSLLSCRLLLARAWTTLARQGLFAQQGDAKRRMPPKANPTPKLGYETKRKSANLLAITGCRQAIGLRAHKHCRIAKPCTGTERRLTGALPNCLAAQVSRELPKEVACIDLGPVLDDHRPWQLDVLGQGIDLSNARIRYGQML